MNSNDNIPNIKKWLSGLLSKGQAFVSFRLPGDNQGTAFLAGSTEVVDISLFSHERFRKTFIVAPFNEAETAFALHPKEDVFSFIPRNLNDDIEKFYPGKEDNTLKSEYSRSFEIVKNALNRFKADKIVLARKMEVSDVPKTLLPEVFDTLCHLYPDAFVYFFDHPDLGRWMGASPESFLEKEEDKLTTVALAATRKGDFFGEDWNLKELEEQGLVSVFVDEVLQQFGVTDYTKTGPEPSRAGQMIHLRTSYSMRSHPIDSVMGKFIQALHPTPAVGGYPKEKALQFIRKAELFDRKFYSGFLGPVFSNGFRFFVNIRSMELCKNRAVLYLGGGITRDSNEEAEWEETKLKARTLLSVLQSVKQNHCNESIHLR